MRRNGSDYLRHVLTRRPPTPEIIAEFQDRYRQIGGTSPLLEISLKQGRALEQKLTPPRRPANGRRKPKSPTPVAPSAIPM